MHVAGAWHVAAHVACVTHTWLGGEPPLLGLGDAVAPATQRYGWPPFGLLPVPDMQVLSVTQPEPDGQLAEQFVYDNVQAPYETPLGPVLLKRKQEYEPEL
jgi:hypothetical protein